MKINKKYFLIFLFILLYRYFSFIPELFAVPAAPFLIKFIQPDSTVFEGYQKGDENYSRVETVDGFTVKKDTEGWWTFAVEESDSAAKIKVSKDGLVPSIYKVGKTNPLEKNLRKNLIPVKQIQPKIIHKDLPKPKIYSNPEQSDTLYRELPADAIKDKNNGHSPKNKIYSIQQKPGAPIYNIIDPSETIVIILIQFSDTTASTPVSYYDTIIAGMKDYYQKQSFGNLTLNAVIAGNQWFTSDSTMAYYGSDKDDVDDSNTSIYELAREAVKKANPSFDFSKYDADADGVIDHVMIVHSGPDQSASGVDWHIWSHSWAIPNPGELADGKRIKNYIMLSENSPLGTFCHEFFHDLGAPDLYDYDYDYVPVGDWCLMAGGSWNNGGATPSNICGYLKMDIDADATTGYSGWLAPLTIEPSQLVKIAKSTNWSDTNGYRLFRCASPDSKEYFLLEYRKKTEYDQYSPDNGLVIYHIDEDMPDNDGTPTNSFYRCWLESSDKPNLSNRSYPNSPEYAFSGNTSRQSYFSPTSTPNSKTNNGVSTGINIYNISKAGTADTMTFQFGVPPEPKYYSNTVIDTLGDNDGKAESNETCSISISIKNNSLEGNVTNLSCTLTVTDTYITILNSYKIYGDIDTNAVATKTYSFKVANNCPTNRTVSFTLNMTDSYSAAYTDSFNIIINSNQTDSKTITTAYHTITIDGTKDFNDTAEAVGSCTTPTDWGASNDLDTLYFTYNADTIYIGIKGTFDATGSNYVVVYLDRDFGSSNGVSDMSNLTDNTSDPDNAISSVLNASSISGFGAELAMGWNPNGSVGGVRRFETSGKYSNFDWVNATVSGNASYVEFAIPVKEIYNDTEIKGKQIALLTILGNQEGSVLSNQYIPDLSVANQKVSVINIDSNSDSILDNYNSTCTITGKIYREAGGETSNTNVWFIKDTGDTLDYEKTVEGGTFSLQVNFGSTGYIKANDLHHLTKKTNFITVNSDTNVGRVLDLIAGDVNENNKINIYDASIVKSKIQTTKADIDKNGIVNSNDLLYVRNNFGKLGDGD